MSNDENFNLDDDLDNNEFDGNFNDDEQNNQDPKEIEDSIKLKDVDIDIKPIKKKRKTNTKSKVSSQDIQDMSDDEIIEISTDEIKELYSEFNSFMESKTDVKIDNKARDVIPTKIQLLDATLGGGFAVGTLNIIVGPPGSGKTMLAIRAMGRGQIKYNGHMFAAFLDAERSTTKTRMANLGVRNPMVDPYTDITVESFFQSLECICLYKEKKGIVQLPSVICWDSIANTLTQKEIEAKDPKEVVGYKARVFSILIPKYVAKLSKYNICLIAINQLRDVMEMGKFAKPKDLKFMSISKDMPGGQSLKYNAFQLLEVLQRGLVYKESEKNNVLKYGFDGIVDEVKCVKNKLFPPNIPINIVGDFVRGFSNFWTNYLFLSKTKRLNLGSWSTLVKYPETKFRTKDAYETYKKDAKFKKDFDAAVEEAIQNEILVKDKIIDEEWD